MTRTLLLDADILAYIATSVNQRSYDWGDGKVTAADETAAQETVEQEITKLAERLQADDVLVCLSDDFTSFRKERVDPTYKAVRGTTERPVHLYDIKAWMVENYDTVRWPTLEADDVMGILATDPNRMDERIIVSADKDMMTIPGQLYRPQMQISGKAPRVMQITEAEADRYHLYQAIVGDATDGYGGLPGAGPTAAEWLLQGLGWIARDHVLKSGPRKGGVEVRWDRELMATPWEAIVSAYVKAGLTEQHAITQARLARILRFTDYDGHTPILWNPPVSL